jgi:uncharacterized membrane protein YoaK (UPF0700 family)
MPEVELVGTVSGICVLALLGGFINAFSFVFFTNVGISGVTNAVTNVFVNTLSVQYGIQMAQGLFYLLQVGCFVAGAVLGGLLAPSPQLEYDVPHGLVFILCGLITVGAALVLWGGSPVPSRMLVALVMGLNHCVTVYHKISLPFTHITGVAANIGAIAGRAMRGRFDPDRDATMLRLYVPVLLSFCLGCAVGSVVSVHPLILLIGAFVYLLFGIALVAVGLIRRKS